MGRPRNPDRPCRLTINLPRSLMEKLKDQASLNAQTLSGLVVSKLTAAITGKPVTEKNFTVICELKSGSSFADLLKQLQQIDSSLKIKHVSGNLDFLDGPTATVETVILPQAESTCPTT